MDRHIDQWSRTEHLKINPFIYSPLIFDKDAKANQLGKSSLFNKWHLDDWISTGTRMKLDPYFTSHTTMITNIRSQNHETLEGHGEQPHTPSLVSGCLDATPRAWAEAMRTNKLGFICIKAFVRWRALSRKWRDNPQSERRYLQIIELDKDLISQTYSQQQQNSTTKGQTASLKMNKGGNSLAVQWSELQTFTAKDLGPSSASSQGNKMLQALGHSQKKGEGLE